MSEFSGKTILITGAGRNLGRETALLFGAEGANICVNYAHSEEAANEVVAKVESSGGRAIAYRADISQQDQVNAMVNKAMESFGTIDVLVNNAGLSMDGPFLEMTEAAWDRVQAVNLKGPFLVSQAVARQMMTGDGGVIVNVSSYSAVRGRKNGANHLASRAGLNMLTACMALELAPKIRVNGVGLGFVDSDLVREVFSEEHIAEVLRVTPLQRMTTYQETANFIRFLASESSNFITGQTIPFEGGRGLV